MPSTGKRGVSPKGRIAGADICLNKIIHVADSSRQARDDMREADPVVLPEASEPHCRRRPECLRSSTSSIGASVRTCLSLADETALEDAAIVGDPEEVADKIRQHHEVLGVDFFMGAFSRGGLPHEKVRRSLELFADKVMPQFA